MSTIDYVVPQNLTKKEIEAKELTKKMDALFNQCSSLFCRKQLDYGSANIAQYGEAGVLVRMTDKFERLKNLLMSGRAAENESVNDTLQDLVNYAGILHLIRAGEWPDCKKAVIRVIE